jgi:hypothetical protein
MSSAFMVALAAPAFAGPDRYDQGYSCTGWGERCVQQQMRLEDGNRAFEKGDASLSNRGDGIGVERSITAGRSDNHNDETVADEVGNNIDAAADDAGDAIGEAANDTGDAISNTADKAGDALGEAANDIGDEIDDAFN